MKKYTKQQALELYNTAFAMLSAVGKHRETDPVSSTFDLRTPLGMLEVNIIRPEYPDLSGDFTMRFKNRVAERPPCLTHDEFAPHSGKWNYPGFQDAPEVVIAELRRRLEWASGGSIVLPAKAQGEFQMTG